MSDRERLHRRLIVGAWTLLGTSVVGWPVTALTVARREPQVVLGLSWVAIILTAAVFLLEAYLKRDVDE